MSGDRLLRLGAKGSRPSAPAAERTLRGGATAKKVVLIVEDSLTIRMHLSSLLQEAGFDVLHATDGELALRQWASRRDLAAVLLDVNLPHLDGIAVLERMQATEVNVMVPVFMLTAGADQEQLARASRLGAAGWFLKPVEPELLVTTLLRLTQS